MQRNPHEPVRSVDALLRVFSTLRHRKPGMTASEIFVLLCVAREPDETSRRYAEMTGLTEPYVVRILRDMSDENALGRPGHELVLPFRADKESNWTRVRWFLSARGEDLVADMVDQGAHAPQLRVPA